MMMRDMRVGNMRNIPIPVVSHHNINRLRYHYDFNYDFNEKKFRGLDILQIGDLICSEGYVVEEHRQWCHEITLVISGEADFIVDNIVYKVREGDLCITPQGSMHSIVATSNSFRYLYMGFSMDLNYEDVTADELLFLQKANSYFLNPPGIQFHDLQYAIQPFTLLVNDFSKIDQYSHISIRSQLISLIIMVIRADDEYIVNEATKHEGALYSGLVAQVVRYVESQDYRIASVGQVADSLGYSKSYLSRLFSEKTGTTLQRFISEMRIRKSMELMSVGHTSVTEVAEYLGFNNVQTFSRTFRQINEMTPSQYLQQLSDRKKLKPKI